MTQRTVVIVDDDPDIRQMLVTALEMAHYRCLVASNGCEALALLDTQRPDVLLLDLMMPQMNGWQLLEVLEQRQQVQWFPIIILSAHPTLTDLTGLPVTAFLSKPFKVAALLTLLTHVLACPLSPSRGTTSCP